MEEQYSLIELVEILTQKLEQNEVQVIEASEFSHLSKKQLYYLDIINQEKNPTPGELAQIYNLSKPSITAIIDKLSKMDYLEKVKSDEDKRSLHVHLTEKGEHIAELHDSIHRAICSYIDLKLSEDEMKIFTSLLQKLI